MSATRKRKAEDECACGRAKIQSTEIAEAVYTVEDVIRDTRKVLVDIARSLDIANEIAVFKIRLSVGTMGTPQQLERIIKDVHRKYEHF
jgi:hypothetical protein